MNNFDHYIRKSTWFAALLAIALVTGCSGGKWDSSPAPAAAPAVTDTTPDHEAVNVAVTTSVNVTFDAAMDAATINDTTFTLTGPADAAVAGAVTYSAANMTATFMPTNDLEYDTSYTATITTDALSATGQALADESVWVFTTATDAPEVTATMPDNDATDVPVSTDVSVTFSTGMDEPTINDTTFTLTGPADAVVAGAITYSATDMTATFTPATELAFDTSYSAAVTTDVLNINGESLLNEHAWTFTTEAAPTVTDTTPDNEAINVAVTSDVSATFSARMDETTINDTTFTLTDPLDAAVAGAVTYSAANMTAVFAPTADLAFETSYSATITTDVMTSTGEPLLTDHVWIFTTAAEVLPVFITVTETAPELNSIDVCTDRNVIANFSMPLEPLSIESPAPGFSMTETESGDAVNGVVTLSENGTTATFNPDADLDTALEYTATITTEVEDLEGNSLEENYAWGFTTRAIVCQQTIALGATEPYGVLSNTSITLGGGPGSTTGFRVDGDVGIYDSGACIGCDTTTVSGVIELGTPAAQAAILALEKAYNEATDRTTDLCTLIDSGVLTTNPSSDCGGGADGIFAPGLYWHESTIAIPAGGTITLDGGNDNDAVFIFKAGSSIDTIGGDTQMILQNGAQAKNVFWVAGSSATIGGTNSDFAGTILARLGITVNTGTVMTGRALGRGAAVTVQDEARIIVPAQ